MSNNHPENTQNGPIKTPAPRVWKTLTAVTILVVPVFAILGVLYYKLAPAPASSAAQDPEVAVAQRLQKVGTVALELGSAASQTPAGATDAKPAEPAAAAAPATAAPAEAAAPAPKAQETQAAASSNGEALYKKSCVACHSTGLAGAPKFGDKAAWAPRIATGLDALVTSSIKGKNAMPPRGASTASDAELKAAVEYMVHAAK